MMTKALGDAVTFSLKRGKNYKQSIQIMEWMDEQMKGTFLIPERVFLMPMFIK